MTRQQATELIQNSLKEFAVALPVPVSEDLFLMRDLDLESVNLLNLLTEIERRLGARIDLIQIMRSRDDRQVYQRDIQFRDLVNYLARI